MKKNVNLTRPREDIVPGYAIKGIAWAWRENGKWVYAITLPEQVAADIWYESYGIEPEPRSLYLSGLDVIVSRPTSQAVIGATGRDYQNN